MSGGSAGGRAGPWPQRCGWPLLAALAAVALAFWPAMRQLTYVRQVLLVGLAAPAAVALGLLSAGPTWAGLAAALAGRPARLMLAAVWGHALLAWASLGWTASPEATLDRSIELTALAAWATGWLLASSGPSAWRRLASGHFGVGALIALIGAAYWLYRHGQGTAPPRLDMPIGNPNTVAVLMIFPAMGAAALLVGAFRRRKSRPWLMYIAIAAGLVGLFTFGLAKSRSGLVGLAVAGMVLAAVHLGRRGRLMLAGAGLVLAFGLTAWLGWNPERLNRAEEQVKLTSIGARYYGAIAAWRIFEAHPLSGSGAGTFLPAAQPRIPPERYLGQYATSFLNLAHNEYAQTAAELGLPGLAALLALLGSALWGAWRWAGRREGTGRDEDPLGRALSAGLVAALAGVTVSSLTDPSLRFWDFTGFFYAAAALAAGADRAGASEEAARGSTISKAAVALGGATLAALATWLWAAPDAIRQLDYASANRLAAWGWPGEACKDYGRAVRARGNFFYRMMARYEGVRALGLAGRAPEALAEAEELARMMPDCPLVLRPLAKARLKAGDRAGALSAMILAGRRDPFDDADCRNLGHILRAEPAAGRSALIEAVGRRVPLAPGERAALSSIAAAADGDWKGALAALDGAQASNADFLPLDFWRGLCAMNADRPAASAAALAAHLERVPLHADGFLLLARAVSLAPDEKAAGRSLAAVLRGIELDSAGAKVYQAVDALRAGRKSPSETLAALGPLLRPTCRKDEVALLVAQSLARQGQVAEARKVLDWGWEQTHSPGLKKAMERLGAPGAESPP